MAATKRRVGRNLATTVSTHHPQFLKIKPLFTTGNVTACPFQCGAALWAALFIAPNASNISPCSPWQPRFAGCSASLRPFGCLRLRVAIFGKRRDGKRHFALRARFATPAARRTGNNILESFEEGECLAVPKRRRERRGRASFFNQLSALTEPQKPSAMEGISIPHAFEPWNFRIDHPTSNKRPLYSAKKDDLRCMVHFH